MRVQGPESRVQGKDAASARPPAPLALRRRAVRTVAVRGALPSPSRRAAFTLTELLVVITIMIILMAITLSAYNLSMSSERSRSAARQMQSYLEGARDRAIYSREARGVRFLFDRDNPRTVSSMVYIGESEPWTQGVIRLERLDDDNDDKADGPDIQNVRGWSTDWLILKQRQLLYDGLRIKIPRGKDGSWYTVMTGGLTSANPRLRLSTPYRDPGTSKADKIIAFEGGGPSTYELELPPVILPGADGEPRLLPRGVVIDLDYSRIPDFWRIRSIANPYIGHMDVMFSPRGSVVGPAAGRGIIHFLLNGTGDTIRAYGPDGLPGQAGVDDAPQDGYTDDPWEVGRWGSDDLRPYDIDVNGNGTIDEDERNEDDKLIVTVFTQTGQISVHPLSQPTAWQPSTAYGDDDRVFSVPPNGWLYRCNSAGTSGTAQASWPTTIGNTCTDNSVTWECRSVYEVDMFRFAETGEVAGQ